MRKVLLITYYFPPISGSGMHRPAAFARHLRDYGYEPVVITPGLEWHGNGATHDAIEPPPTDVRVFRTPPDAAFSVYRRLRRLNRPATQFARVLESRVAWAWSACRAARALMERESFDAILTSAPPWGVSLAGAILHRETQLPWVSDMRDPWALTRSAPWVGGAGYFLDRAAFAWANRLASKITVQGPSCFRELCRWSRGIATEKGTFITNGFRKPSEDLAPMPAVNGQMRLTHVGLFYWTESDRAKSRSFRGRIARAFSYHRGGIDRSAHSVGFLLRSIKTALEIEPELRQGLLVTLVGRLDPSEEKLAERMGLADMVRMTGQVPWKESARAARETDVLYLPFWKRLNADPEPRIPSKTLEYVGTGKPVLAVVDDDDARAILRKAGTGIFTDDMTEAALARKLVDTFHTHRKGGLKTTWNREFAGQFNWERATERMAHVLDDAIAGRSWTNVPLEEHCHPPELAGVVE